MRGGWAVAIALAKCDFAAETAIKWNGKKQFFHRCRAIVANVDVVDSIHVHRRMSFAHFSAPNGRTSTCNLPLHFLDIRRRLKPGEWFYETLMVAGQSVIGIAFLSWCPIIKSLLSLASVLFIRQQCHSRSKKKEKDESLDFNSRMVYAVALHVAWACIKGAPNWVGDD